MAIDLKPLSSTYTTEDIGQLVLRLKDILQDLEAQLNDKAVLYTNLKGETPNGLAQGDLLVTSLQGKITVKIKNTRNFDVLTASMLNGLTANGTSFLGLVTNNIDPPTSPTVFPNADDWGFYHDSNTGKVYLCYNLGSNLLKHVQLT